MKEDTTIVQQCLDILKREDVKYELRSFLTYIINLIMYESRPFIYTIIILISLLFLMNLAILILLIFILRNKNLVSKLF